MGGYCYHAYDCVPHGCGSGHSYQICVYGFTTRAIGQSTPVASAWYGARVAERVLLALATGVLWPMALVVKPYTHSAAGPL